MSLVIDLAVALFMVWITWWWLHDELVFMSFLLGEKGFHASFLFTTVAFTFLFFVVGAIALLRQAFICGQPGKREHRSLQIIFLTIKTSILSNRGRLLFELIGYIYILISLRWEVWQMSNTCLYFFYFSTTMAMGQLWTD